MVDGVRQLEQMSWDDLLAVGTLFTVLTAILVADAVIRRRWNNK